MVIKCKICGGDVAFTPGDTYGTCSFCGSTSTIPQGNDEQKLNLFNRANYFRRQGEFDKALAAYERLLEQDDTDAEAHWGAALSRYGIEYVEDPATKKRLPTCHRLQVASILADEDYKAAVSYAPDAQSRRLYVEEAHRIAEIQKGILTISQNEKPYDVFICYKETDEHGRRTRDSQWAQEVYYGLTEQGYKVFFSRITLEDKLGQEYEPYIFAALNSARVMIVIGSKPEYFNAVWVRNEWSRYLTLMANDRKRLLIPCYRDMDPYDLPDELSSLQSQDMSKIGFMQDLLRGVRKVLDTETQTVPRRMTQPIAATVPAASLAPGVDSLLERAYLFMEDGNYDSAAEYIDRVLDIDPKYAPAYAAKVCVKLKLTRESDLAEVSPVYENDPDWNKVMRFADTRQKLAYEGYLEKACQKAIYQQAMQKLEFAHDSIEQLNKLANTFDAISDYQDARAQAVRCRKEAEILDEKERSKADVKCAMLYDHAVKLMSRAGEASSKWKAVKHLLADPRLNGYRDVNLLRIKAAKRFDEAKKKRNIMIGIIAAVIVIAVIVWGTQVIIPSNNYRNAIALKQAGKYEEAITAFETLNGYSDSVEQIEVCQTSIKERDYKAAIALQQAGRYEEAIIAFTALGSYSNSSAQIKETKYLQAKALTAAGDYAGAVSIFSGIKGYKDVDSLLARDAKYSVGNYVTFGHYPQTSGGNDNTPIEWLVLARDGNKALLISRYGLDAKPYNEKPVDITWENCSLRTWLNGTFLNKAFTAQEQAGIVLTNVDNSSNQGYSKWNTNGGNNTQDKIFLLSYAEANKYLGVTYSNSSNTISRVAPTAYALKQGAYKSNDQKTADGEEAGLWWLRSPGGNLSSAARMIADGSLGSFGVSSDSTVVRPALWIDLESGIF